MAVALALERQFVSLKVFGDGGVMQCTSPARRRERQPSE